MARNRGSNPSTMGEECNDMVRNKGYIKVRPLAGGFGTSDAA